VSTTAATLIATAVVLGWILLATCAAVIIGRLIADRPQVMLADTFAEHEDEPLEVDPPTSRPHIPPIAAKPKDLHRSCVVAYAERDYAAICKTCTPRMGVKA
jgi:hypothetical protein